jgi:hypothetical protein
VTQTIETGNALGLDFTPKTFSLEDQAVATSTPQAESLRAPPHHQDARGVGCTYQEHQAFHGDQHLAPPSDSRADDTLAGEVPQVIRLGADVSDAAGPEVSRKQQNSLFQSMKRALHSKPKGCVHSLAREPTHTLSLASPSETTWKIG